MLNITKEELIDAYNKSIEYELEEEFSEMLLKYINDKELLLSKKVNTVREAS
ncbi:hypothetical protein [Halalkalibacter krulwichiae]|uniref:Sporulation inhibitor sda n=1 Tax=Halalkalibacter krulwichiae TaxID=199441 RepID=A0A1X9MGK5_9BACI|nr:hypothetical protein [Halalkalibacter krulwichiae]ARK32587.1 hypothetical protein BkAM31D_23450 [Halalkalibacter krulwichiae]